MEQPPATYQVDGAAIRIRRMELGMTQAMCAEAAQISRPYLALIELGLRRDMRPPTYAGLRTALHIEPTDRRLLTPCEGQHRKESDGQQADAPRPHPHEDG
jgi:transcriptional regulator with XRE-family HTH domain